MTKTKTIIVIAACFLLIAMTMARAYNNRHTALRNDIDDIVIKERQLAQLNCCQRGELWYVFLSERGYDKTKQGNGVMVFRKRYVTRSYVYWLFGEAYEVDVMIYVEVSDSGDVNIERRQVSMFVNPY